VEAPFFVIPFDERGTCTGPATRDRLVALASSATDVYVFSHGWNTDWRSATSRYDQFIRSYVALRAHEWPQPDRRYRPILAGVFWPSAALVAPDEQAPDIAAGDADVAHAPDAAVMELAAGLPADKAARLYELADRDTVSVDEGRELVALVGSQLAPDDEVPGAGSPRDPDQLMQAWLAVSSADGGPGGATSSPTGTMLDDDVLDDAPGADDLTPEAAFGLTDLSPRNLFRLTTVLKMKDRAGVVGSHGVADLLGRLHAAHDPEAAPPRIHLIGHSYGAKVLLSALRAAPGGQAVVDSVLLLQPAISAYCFAAAGEVPGTADEGGYRPTLGRTRQPVLCTFSRHDLALHRLFHWAARRAADLGEARVAAEPPSRYAALGGHGPQPRRAFPVVDAVHPPEAYRFPGGRAVGIRSDDVIGGHGDIVSPAVSWMLLSQVRG
jgi:hypothetical protein